MANHFADRITKAIKSKNTPLVVGLDPVYDQLPEKIINHKSMNDANDAASAIDAILEFCTRVLRIAAPLVPAVKLNSAFFERYLWEGVESYYTLLAEAEELGIETIGDVKRGDIGHTCYAYADGHLKNVEMVGLEGTVTPDAITINGFAGEEGIRPFADTALQNGKGVFVWVRASNPSAAAIGDFTDAAGRAIYEVLAEQVDKIASEPQRIGSSGYSNVGMIVGGTSPAATAKLREKYPRTIFLVPGLGSQGATAADCVRFCRPDGTGALINASRSIIYAYNNPQYKSQFADNWERAIEQAILDTKKSLAEAIVAGK